MTLRSALFLIPYLVSALITIWVGLHAWRRRSVPGARLFAGIAFFEAVWSFGYIFQLVTPGLVEKIFWNDVQFLGAVCAPLAYFGFAVDYDRTAGVRVNRFSWKHFAPLAVLLLLFIWTDGLHGLFRGGSYLAPGDPFPRLVFPNGSGYVIYTLYAYSIMVLTTLILIARYLVAPQIYRIQVGIVLGAVLIPWVTTVITALELAPVKLHEITPLTFGISNLIVSWALFRYHLFRIVPVARDFLVENMREGVIVLDGDLRIADLNPAAQKILALKKNQALGRELRAFLAMERTWFEKLASGSSEKHVVSLEIDGSPRFYEIQSSLLQHPKGDTGIFLVILRDIQDQKKLETRLRYLAVTDPLTGVYNRGHVFRLAEQHIQRAKEQRQDLSMIIFDIDHFKQINDAFGHQTGDQALVELVRVCQDNLRTLDIFGRYGGEEFLVILPGLDAVSAGQVAERLRSKVAGLQLDGLPADARVTISLGVASLTGNHGEDLDSLIAQADRALYQAKAEGRNRVSISSEFSV